MATVNFKTFLAKLRPTAVKFITREGDNKESYSFMRVIYPSEGEDKAVGLCFSPELKTLTPQEIVAKAKDLVVSTEEKTEAEVVNGEVKTVTKNRYWLGLSEGTDIMSDLLAALSD